MSRRGAQASAFLQHALLEHICGAVGKLWTTTLVLGAEDTEMTQT